MRARSGTCLTFAFVLALGACQGKGRTGGGSGGAAGLGATGDGSGGAAASGGVSGTAGTTASGGHMGTGGVASSGGVGPGGRAGTGGARGSGGATGTGGAQPGGTGGATAAGGTSGAAGASGDCIGASMLGKLGKNRLLVGVSTSDTVAAMAPFDLRYIYLSGGLFDSPAPCTACGSACTASGNMCTNGCNWWGCYNTPPGMYVGYFMQAAAKNGQVPMFTYYEILQTAQATFTGFSEGKAEVTQAAVSAPLMTRYYADWRFLLQQIGTAEALLHIEPDFWGYARQAGAPTSVAAAVASANPTDCGALPDTIAGMGQCLIAMVRKYAPNALVGLHASAWNIASNSDNHTDVTTDAKSLATFLAACGQSDADFIVVETSDRDAGYYQTVKNQNYWWDATDTTLPDYAQHLTWVKALTEALGTPALYWQTPLGNASQSDVPDHYQDNRVDYFFGGTATGVLSAAPTTVPAHWSGLAAAHVIGVAFGAGAGDQTTPETDGGYLVAKTEAYVAGGGQALCP